MEKTIEYYMNLPYTRELIPEPEGGWFVRIKELPNCMSQGDTPEEALNMIEDAMRGWLEVEIEDGESIPEPSKEEEYSGKFNTRVPKSLHRKLVESANREGVSLNQWINTALAEAVGQSAAPKATMKKNGKEETWPGLSTAMKNVLADVGMGIEAQAVDERLFARWLDDNIAEIHSDIYEDKFDQALEKTRAFSSLLVEHQQHSSVLQSMGKFIDEISNLLELNLDMKQKVAQVEMIQEQIGNVLSAINLPFQTRREYPKKIRFSDPITTGEPLCLESATFTSEW